MRTMQRAGLAAATVAVLASAVVGAGGAEAAGPGKAPYTFAVIGDIPYGDAQIERFPRVVDQINDDPGWISSTTSVTSRAARRCAATRTSR